MADAAISFAVQKLGDALSNKVKFLRGVEDEVRFLIRELEAMRCFLVDAENKQVEDKVISNWISEVREVAQDAEDVVEIYFLKTNTRRTMRERVRMCVGLPAHAFHLNRVGTEIESIKRTLDDIKRRRDMYNIQATGTESSSRSRSEIVEMPTSRLQNDKHVVGLKEDADLLIKQVILDEDKRGLSLAVVEGMGGIGKTTLARKIYNHPDIVAAFQKRVWVVISNKFVLGDILKQIMYDLSLPLEEGELKNLKSMATEQGRETMLQKMLHKRLEGKRYFMVLDDMWEKEDWTAMENAFPDEQGGRQKKVRHQI